MEEQEGHCIFPMLGDGVQVDLVMDTHAGMIAFVVSVRNDESVHFFAMGLDGALHVKQHLNEAIDWLMKEKEIRESN